MATQNRTKPRNQAPVTSHPLFSSVVALWFGALFGFGSLAVRTSLLESAVLALHLDVMFSAAAPPLGMISRIILALVMGAIGIAAGAFVARWIARPKATPQERRRGAGMLAKTPGLQAASAAEFSRAAQPESAYPGQVDMVAMRRRPLALQEASPRDFAFDTAPLPGGAPHILDVTKIDLRAPGEDLPETGTDVTITETAALPINQNDDYIASDFTHQTFAAPAEPVIDAAVAPIAQFAEPETFAEVGSVVVIDPELPTLPAPASAFAVDTVWEPNQSFISPPAAPQFARAFDAAPVDAAPASLDEPLELAQEFVAPVAEIAIPDNPAQAEIAFAQPVSEPRSPQGTAASRIASSELAELSPVELIERLALALKQRLHEGPVPAVLAEAAAALGPVAPASPAAPPPGEMPFAALPRFALPTASEAPTLAEPEPVPPSIFGTLASLSGLPAAPVASVADSRRLALPAALRPIDFSAYDDHDDDAQDYALPPRSMVAVAPIIAAIPTTASESAVVLALAVEQITTAPQTGDDEIGDDAPEDAYSSLLDLVSPTPMRQNFVRIDEPQDDVNEIEPVVIFPGHQARVGTRFAQPAAVPTGRDLLSAPEPITDDGRPQLRRFDAPSVVAAAAVPGPSPVKAPDAAETELALRSALATLQRMSGAA